MTAATDPAACGFALTLAAEAFNRRFRLELFFDPPRLEFLGGPVSTAVPIVIQYPGSRVARTAALNLATAIHAIGYVNVRIERRVEG